MQNAENAKPGELMEATLSMPSTEMLGKLETAEVGMSRTVTYKKQEDWQLIKDQPVRCFFIGMKEVPNEEGETVLCAGFMSKDEVFIAAQLVLVDAVRGLKKGTPIEITFNGSKANKSSKGKTNLFTVKLLNL